MSNSYSVSHQYRTFEYIYLFKVKEEKITLKIFDLCQKCLLKQAIDHKEVDLSQIKTHSIFKILKILTQKEILSEKYLSQEVPLTSPVQMTAQAIQKYKPQALAEPKELQNFTCPLTLDIFQNPVMDEHGHTFEKEAIEEHLKNDGSCPINRQPIKTLSPNLLIKQTIESYQNQDPIPTQKLFQKENHTLASKNIEMAQDYLRENEYEEAIDSLIKALKYTKSLDAYALLPSIYQKMGASQKTILATLYLTQYHIEQKSLKVAIQTLEEVQIKTPEIDHLLILLYQENNQPKEALQCAKTLASTLSKSHADQAIVLYTQILQKEPHHLELYPLLTSIQTDPQRKRETLMTGICHALIIGNYQLVKEWIEEVKKYGTPTFLDHLLTLDLLKHQDDHKQLKHTLEELARTYGTKKEIRIALKLYKMLFQLEETEESCQKILSAYQTLGKKAPQIHWYAKYLELLIQNKNWQQGEKIAQEALNILQEKIPIYLHLETIYEKAYKQFHSLDHALALADTLNKQNQIAQSVKTYYQASESALLEGRVDVLSLCAKKIQEVDSQMKHLDAQQRMALLTQKMLYELNKKVLILEKELKPLKEKAQIKEEKKLLVEKERKRQEKLEQQQKEEKRIAEEHEKTRLEKIERKRLEELSQSFGKAKWEKYFGDIGTEPPLPKDIDAILSSKCPFWPGKTVKETHLLVLIPEKVDKKPFTLNALEKLIQSPKTGHATMYRYYHDDVKNELGNQSNPSHWCLMSKDEIPNSRNKNYDQQKQMVAGYPTYALPKGIEAVTAILMHYVETGERLYTDSPHTYTRCEEKVSNDRYPVVVGGFGADGLVVSSRSYVNENNGFGSLRSFH